MPDKVLKTKKISRDEAMELRKNHIKSVGNSTAVLKASKGKTSFNSEKRSARFVMSSESVDRYGDIVVQAGLDTERFMDNPQGLMFHNSRSWPIGLWSDVAKVLTGRPRRTEGTLNFLAEGIEPDADRAVRHVEAGTLRAVSIGFIPDWDEVEMLLDDEEKWTGGLRFSKSELIECSVVPIPAAPDAMIKDASGDMAMAKELIEDVLDNWARDPATGLLLERKDYEQAYRVVMAKAFDDLAVKPVERALGALAVDVAQEGAAADVVEEEAAQTEPALAEAAGEPSHPNEKEVPGYAEDLSAAEKGDEFVYGVDENGNDYVAALRDGAVAFRTIFDTREKAEDAVAKRTLELHAGEAGAGEEIEVIELKVDTSQLDDATERVGALSLMLDAVGEKFAKFFGKSAPAERIEPKLDTPPSPEVIAAALSKVKAARERVLAKGLT